MNNLSDEIQETWHRAVDTFYVFFSTDEYLDKREPALLHNKWICRSVEWQLFNTHKEAVAALKQVGKEPV